jgi:hypothetical protein
MPLKFDTLEQALNIIGLIGLLNFGSGFRKELHEECGRVKLRIHLISFEVFLKGQYLVYDRVLLIRSVMELCPFISHHLHYLHTHYAH